jgi:rare lipoprotein A
MPMGTILRVTRPPDGPSVEVRVNDRCGGAHGRQLDLSEAAARRLNLLRVGTAQVRIEVLGRRPVR